ncbi:hypothetical protein GQ457_12G019210 [Hibiscus cannabinus]
MVWIEHTMVFHFERIFTRKSKFDYVGDVSVEEVDVNDNRFNVGEVEVDVGDRPTVSLGPIVALRPTFVDAESTGVVGPSNDVEPIVEVDVGDRPTVSLGPIVALRSTFVDAESTGVVGPSNDVEPIVEVDVGDRPTVSLGPIVALRSTFVDVESTGVVGSSNDIVPIGMTVQVTSH